MNIQVLYFIEHVARELDIACAVKTYLESEYQLPTQVASISLGLQKTLRQHSPQVVVLPYGNTLKNAGLEDIVARYPNAKYLNLAFEQVLGKIQKGFKVPRDDFAKQYVLYSVWGEFFAEFLTGHGVARENIRVNGSPTANLYQSPFKEFYHSQKEHLGARYNLDPHKRWVLIPENYAWAFFNDDLVEHRIKGGYNAQLAYDYRDFAFRSLKEVSQWWASTDIPSEVEIIIRPRPAIPSQIFIDKVKSFAGELPNTLHFIKDGTVREWILASDVVMSSFSTSLIEAALASKPIYMLMPYEIPDLLHNEFYDHCPKLETFDQYRQALTAEDDTWQSLQGWANNTFAAGQNAPKNIAGTIARLHSGEIPLSPPTEIAAGLKIPSQTDILFRQFKKTGWQSSQKLKRWLGLPSSALSNPSEKDHFTQNDVDSRVKKWKTVLNL